MLLSAIEREISIKHFPSRLDTGRNAGTPAIVLPVSIRLILETFGRVNFYSADDPPYTLRGASELRRTRVDVFGDDTDKWGPRDVFTVFETRDGYLSVLATSVREDKCTFVECFHEEFGFSNSMRVVAFSGLEMFERILNPACRHPFYLNKDFVDYGRI